MSMATRERRRRESADLTQETENGAAVFPQQAASAVDAADEAVPVDGAAVDQASPAPAPSLTAQAAGLYRDLVQQRARGELTSVDDRTLHILAGVGKSVAQFETDVAKLRERLAAGEQLQRAAGLQSEIDQAHRALDSAIADHAKLVEETNALIQEKWRALKKIEGEAESLIGHQRALVQAANTVLHASANPKIAAAIESLKKQRHAELLALNARNPANKPGTPKWTELTRKFGEKIAELERSITDPVLGLFPPAETE